MSGRSLIRSFNLKRPSELRGSVIIANRKDIILNLAHRRINSCTMEVVRVRSLQDCHQQVLVTHDTKEAHDEIDEVDDVLLSLPRKRCYPRRPCSHTVLKN